MNLFKRFLQNFKKRHHGFSLIEVNMAIFVLAGGALALLSLFPFGLQQSRNATNEMILSACADRFLGAAAAIATQPGLDYDIFVEKLKDLSGFNNIEKFDKSDEVTKDKIDDISFHEFPNSNKGLYYYAYAYPIFIEDSDNQLVNVHLGIMVSTENCKQSKAARERALLFMTKVMLDNRKE